MTNAEDSAFIAFYIFIAIAMTGNLAIIIHIIINNTLESFYKDSNYFARLVLYLHVSVLFECVTLLPYVYKFNHDFCLFIEAVKVYFGLMNLSVIFIIIQSHRLSLLHQTIGKFSPQLTMTANFFMFVLPLIAFLPFTDNGFSYPDVPWCSLPESSSKVWAFFVQYLWVWLVLIISASTNIYVVSRILRVMKDFDLFLKFATNGGAFSFISAISWIPRSYSLFSNKDTTSESFARYFPAVFAAILYCVLYVINQGGIDRYQSEASKSINETITWDTRDILGIFSDLTSEGRNTLGENLSLSSIPEVRGPKHGDIQLSSLSPAENSTDPRKSESFIVRWPSISNPMTTKKSDGEGSRPNSSSRK